MGRRRAAALLQTLGCHRLGDSIGFCLGDGGPGHCREFGPGEHRGRGCDRALNVRIRSHGRESCGACRRRDRVGGICLGGCRTHCDDSDRCGDGGRGDGVTVWCLVKNGGYLALLEVAGLVGCGRQAGYSRRYHRG